MTGEAADPPSRELLRENETLRRQLAECQETMEAIRGGEVDALVVTRGGTNRVFTLEGVDRPYRLFVEEMQQGAVTLDPDGAVLYCNAWFAHLLQRHGDELPGSNFEDHVAPASRPAWRGLRGQAERGRAAGEVALQRRDGSLLPTFVAVSALRGGQEENFALVVADLTEQKQFERLVVAERELQEASRGKDHFLALLGHELRNPLAAIRNAVALQKQVRQAGGGEAVLVQAGAILERQVLQMVRLVDDLLEVSRLVNGKVALRLGDLDLAAVVRSVVTDQHPLLEARGLEVELRVPDRPMPAFGDAARIGQILANLLTNATKFTEPGGRVTIALERDAQGSAALTVRDTGQGIDPDLLDHLFEPFVQAPAALEHTRGGLGLGLALSRSLAELHGGRIRAHSPGLGQGAEFTVVLPILADGAGGEAPAEVASVGARPLRILVVEDNLDAAETLRMLLDCHGHDVRVAHSGRMGLASAEARPPEVVLCDIGLPGDLDGYGVAAALRRMPKARDAHLVAMTGFTGEEASRRALAAGFDRHLAKPADPDALLRMLAELGGRG